MAATKTKSASSKKPSSAKKSADKARTASSTGATRKSSGKTKDERIVDALKRPAHQEEELALSDIELFLRDNPSLRSPDNSRRHLPVEEFPSGDPVRKAHAKALKVIDDAIDTLEADASVDPVLGDKIHRARRVLRS